MLFEVFFEGEFLFEDISGDVFADEAEVPGFVIVAGDGFFAFGIAEDEAILRELGVNLGEDFAFGDHLVVVVDENAIFDDADVDGETGVVFAEAGPGEVFFTIFFAVFFLPFVPDFFLFFSGAVSAVEFDLDAVFEQVFAKGVEVRQGDFFDEESVSEGVLGFDEFDVVEPVVGEFVFLVDEGQVRVEVAELGFDGGRRVVIFRQGEQSVGHKQITENQSNNLFHEKCTPLNNLSFYYITKCLFLQYLGLFEVEGVEEAIPEGGFCGEGVGDDGEERDEDERDKEFEFRFLAIF